MFPGAWNSHSTSLWAQRTRPDGLGLLPPLYQAVQRPVPDKRKVKDKNFH